MQESVFPSATTTTPFSDTTIISLFLFGSIYLYKYQLFVRICLVYILYSTLKCLAYCNDISLKILIVFHCLF